MELNTAQPEDQPNVDLQKAGRHKEQTEKQKLDALVHKNILTNTQLTHIHNHIHIFSHLQLCCNILTSIQTFFLFDK